LLQTRENQIFTSWSDDESAFRYTKAAAHSHKKHDGSPVRTKQYGMFRTFIQYIAANEP